MNVGETCSACGSEVELERGADHEALLTCQCASITLLVA
jgi:uncharacterized protein (DUF983 family)